MKAELEQATAVAVPQEVQTGLDKIVVWSTALRVLNSDDRALALSTLKQVKEKRSAIVAFFEPMKTAAHAAWKKIVAAEKEWTDKCDAVESSVKRVVLAYDDEQAKILAREQARLQAEADEAARKERERLKKEAARLKTPEKREERLAQAASVAAPVIQVAAPEKMEGVSTRKVWSAQIVSMADLVKAAASGNELAMSFLCFNQSAAAATARATKGAVTVPGVKFVESGSLAIR